MSRFFTLRHYVERLLNCWPHASNKSRRARSRNYLFKRYWLLSLEQLEYRLAPSANTVDWADWTSSVAGQAGSAQATITVPSISPITVSYSGEVTFANTNGGPQYWLPATPYLSASVGNAPSLTRHAFDRARL